MTVIRVNYNNAAIKKAALILPELFCYKIDKVLRIDIEPHIKDEPYYKEFMFEIYIDGELITYITQGHPNENGLYYIEITTEEIVNKATFYIYAKGYYLNKQNEKYNFETAHQLILTYPKASESIVCSELLKVSDITYGYLYNNEFYLTKIDETYSDKINPEEITGQYYDYNSENVYEWDRNTAQYIQL